MNNNVVRCKVFESFGLFEAIRLFIDKYNDKIDIITTVSASKYTAVYYQYKNTYSDKDIKDKNFEL